MPALGLTLGKMFALDPALVAGMVLVGSINGGQAFNLCTFIANGNVALSVLMTTATTIGAIFMTPVVVQDLSGHGRARRRRRYCRVYSTGGAGPYLGGHDDERQVPESSEEDHARHARGWDGFYLPIGGGRC